MKFAVDFDGTLVKWPMVMPAVYDPNLKFDASKVGESVEPMVERVREWLKHGHEVVIFTARVHPGNKEDAEIARKAIDKWSLETFGIVLEVTCMKDPMIDEIWDDRAITVEKDTGRVLTLGYQEEKEGADSLGSFLEG